MHNSLTGYSNREIFNGIREKDNAVLHYVYKTLYPIIREFVLRNKGKAEDAKDVFQEALVVIYRKTQEDTINLHSSFTSYLYTISRFIWLKMMRQRKQSLEKLNEIIRPLEMESDEIRTIEESMERKIYQYYFDKLGTECKEILTLFYHEYSFREIAEKLGMASEDQARRKKHSCKETLIKLIKADPEIHDIMDE